jgi:hypothetical protein
VLDASECPPTFGVSPELVQGVIAGGYDACYRAVEASEDDAEAGAADLKQRGFGPGDVLVGIAASGRTPYTVGAVKYARSIGSFHGWSDVCARFANYSGGGVEHRSGCWTRSIDRFEQAQSRHGAEDGAEHDLDGDDGAAWLCERQPHVEPARRETSNYATGRCESSLRKPVWIIRRRSGA